MRIIRVFPRKTNATPTDELVRIGCFPTFWDEADEIHISVAFTWDLPYAEILAKEWSYVAPVTIGGPATGVPEGIFIPGMYLKKGWVITSRGCKNRCKHCAVWKKRGEVTTFPIMDGYIVQDDNLLGCPEQHIKDVFKMLAKQSNPADIRGLEAKLLKPWHVELFTRHRINQLWFAYDTPDDLEPLVEAGKMLSEAGYTYRNRKARAYVLIGYEDDTLQKAHTRLMDTVKAGFMPFAMLYKDDKGRSKPWGKFQREWCRPAIIASNVKLLMNSPIDKNA